MAFVKCIDLCVYFIGKGILACCTVEIAAKEDLMAHFKQT